MPSGSTDCSRWGSTKTNRSPAGRPWPTRCTVTAPGCPCSSWTPGPRASRCSPGSSPWGLQPWWAAGSSGPCPGSFPWRRSRRLSRTSPMRSAGPRKPAWTQCRSMQPTATPWWAPFSPRSSTSARTATGAPWRGGSNSCWISSGPQRPGPVTIFPSSCGSPGMSGGPGAAPSRRPSSSPGSWPRPVWTPWRCRAERSPTCSGPWSPRPEPRLA